tara:strand:+ start:1230 stop:1862 length:633 start_codon:yes stop_codon:yes gene_type:complete
MMPRKYKAGDRFGRLVIVEAYHSKSGKRWMHFVECDCGSNSISNGRDMEAGKTRSCGCLRLEEKTTHGMAREPEYAIWAAMIQRCTNPRNAAYANYGGRGIRVCPEWLSFDAFIGDVGRRGSKNLTLERVDNDDSYGPENCIWAPRVAQSLNQRIRKDNKSGFRGVSAKGNAFVAEYQANGKRVYVGRFKNATEANTNLIKHKESNGEIK